MRLSVRESADLLLYRLEGSFQVVELLGDLLNLDRVAVDLVCYSVVALLVGSKGTAKCLQLVLQARYFRDKVRQLPT